ncbi:MAG: efflux transporter outer membrane subunit [Smithella sp.]|jgi:NodT family efflux transporter outer membrane factor (OMF) lipoprotein
MSLQRNKFVQLALPVLPVLFIIVISGCPAVGPDYVRPDTTIYKNWNTQIKSDSNKKETPAQNLASWWTALGDPMLSSLIDRAQKGNLDLKKAQASIREARARRGLAKASFFPTIEASGSDTRSRGSENTGGVTTVNSNVMTGVMTSDLYSLGFDASWELDIFGGVRRSVEAAGANLEASRENMRDVLVSLLAEVAKNYVDVRTYQARIAIAQDNLKAQEETYQLTVWRNEAGLSDELAVQQARYNLENTRSNIPALRTGLDAAMNSIAILLGEQPGKVHEELSKRESIPVTPLNIAVGVPADIIRRRPDIRKAERELASQTAQIGVATADLYPKFTLSGSIGLESISTGNLLSSGSRNYSFGPSITIPIFSGGATIQNIEIQSALQEQYLIAYKTTILDALKEVENALTAYVQEQYRRQALIDAAAAAKQAAQLSKTKYQAGLSDFSDVLDAQRSLLSYEDELATSEGMVTTNLISLYKALGGGWTSSEGKN